MDFGNYTKSMAISFVIQLEKYLILVILRNSNFGLFYCKKHLQKHMDAMKISAVVIRVLQLQIFLEVLVKDFLTQQLSKMSFGIGWLKLTITSS